jgi:hypothetical protein
MRPMSRTISLGGCSEPSAKKKYMTPIDRSCSRRGIAVHAFTPTLAANSFHGWVLGSLKTSPLVREAAVRNVSPPSPWPWGVEGSEERRNCAIR